MGDNVSDNTVESASASATENASENKSDSATEVKSDGATETDKKIELDSKSSKTLEINLGASPKKEEPKKEPAPAPAPAPKVVVVDAPKKEEPKKEEPKVVVVEKPKKEPAPAPPVKDDAAINKALMSIYDQLKALSDTTVAQQNEIR